MHSIKGCLCVALTYALGACLMWVEVASSRSGTLDT